MTVAVLSGHRGLTKDAFDEGVRLQREGGYPRSLLRVAYGDPDDLQWLAVFESRATLEKDRQMEGPVLAAAGINMDLPYEVYEIQDLSALQSDLTEGGRISTAVAVLSGHREMTRDGYDWELTQEKERGSLLRVAYGDLDDLQWLAVFESREAFERTWRSAYEGTGTHPDIPYEVYEIHDVSVSPSLHIEH